jgi:hypothetical protein
LKDSVLLHWLSHKEASQLLAQRATTQPQLPIHLVPLLKDSLRPNGLAVAGNCILPPSGACDSSLEVNLFLISKADLHKIMSSFLRFNQIMN